MNGMQMNVKGTRRLTKQEEEIKWQLQTDYKNIMGRRKQRRLALFENIFP